ncbi:EnvZ/OmpR regulon moderator MzrA [Rouxiella chamberiensis]|uniref:EnvZ/OmpR regulon moderator MzrA n=1 Tax=Rouxiella chamberiensis TaxID=1513468 RepID=A0ABY7HMY4_9GAMM|nr:EnvZ/OmpR regulon moderator MzrA [Rouxiella chamberiensis]WAT00266.1 EnvZ/OmpR regulon moderator MzrA [Rouxiella chamberiensis]
MHEAVYFRPLDDSGWAVLMFKRTFSKRLILWPLTFAMLLMLTTVGVIALPKMPENSDALKISPARMGEDLPDGFTLYQGLSQHGVQIDSITPANGSLVVRLHSSGQQHLAQETLKALLPGHYNIQPYSPEPSHEWASKFARDRSKVG